MNPFKVQRLWKITYQYGLDGIRHEMNLSGFIMSMITVILIGICILAALFIFNVRGLSRTSEDLAKLKQENLLLRQKLDYYSGIVDSIYQRIEALPSQHRQNDSGRYYPYFQKEDNSQISDNTFVYDSYLDARVNSIALLLGKISSALDLDTEALAAPVAVTYKNDQLSIDSGPSIFPAFGRWSDGWGTRLHPFYSRLYFHYGVDIANKLGTPIYATADGEVILTGYDREYGKLIKIRHDNGFETRYGHLYSFQVALGDKVRKGQIIALMGNTGMSTGPHLHYEVLVNGVKVNPARYLNRIDEAVYYARR
jgi:murein DD-endopeptidase MepM/ murein hydrolase activator NlpD